MLACPKLILHLYLYLYSSVYIYVLCVHMFFSTSQRKDIWTCHIVAKTSYIYFGGLARPQKTTTQNVIVKKARIHPSHKAPAVVGVHLRLSTTRIGSEASNHNVKVLKVDLEIQGTSQHFHDELATTAWSHQTLDSFHKVLSGIVFPKTSDRYLQHPFAYRKQHLSNQWINNCIYNYRCWN